MSVAVVFIYKVVVFLSVLFSMVFVLPGVIHVIWALKISVARKIVKLK